MKRTFASNSRSLAKKISIALCFLCLLGTQTGLLNAQKPGVDWNITTTITVKSSIGYDYNFTSFGIYNGTYYNLYYPLNYSGNPPLIIQFGGYAGIDNGLANLVEDSPLCGYLASLGYAVLEFGYKTGGTIPEATQTCLEVLTGTILPWVENQSFPLNVNKTEIGLCGHSAGASAVLGLASTLVASSVALAPYYLSTSLVPQVQNTAPTLILTGQDDTLAPYRDNGTAYYKDLVAPKAILDIKGADHNLGVGVYDFNTAGTNATQKYVTAWFDSTLKGNFTAASFFASGNLKDDSAVDTYQLETATSGANSNGVEKSDFAVFVTSALIVIVILSLIAGLIIYRKRKRR